MISRATRTFWDAFGRLEAWRRHSEQALPGYHFICQSPEAIERGRLEEAWNRFRAAVS